MKNTFFFFSWIVKTKICIIERLLSGSLLFRNDCIHYERSGVSVCVCSLAQLPGLADWLPLWLCLCWSNVRAQLTIIDVSFNENVYRHFVWCARAVVLPRQDCDDGKQTLVCWIGWCWLLPLKCTNVKEFGMFVLRLIARASVSVEFHFILQCLNTHIFMAKKSFRVVYIYAQCIVYTENSCMLSTSPHSIQLSSLPELSS